LFDKWWSEAPWWWVAGKRGGGLGRGRKNIEEKKEETREKREPHVSHPFFFPFLFFYSNYTRVAILIIFN